VQRARIVCHRCDQEGMFLPLKSGNTMADIYRWIFKIPLPDVRTTAESTTDGTRCVLCGKKLQTAPYLVQLLHDGNLVSTDQEFSDSQGFFPLGSECKNRLPNNFYFKNG
jgi:hypothetical protein